MSIHELFKDESLNNMNHHIKCFSLDTKNMNVENFTVDNITANQINSKLYNVIDNGYQMTNAYEAVQHQSNIPFIIPFLSSGFTNILGSIFENYYSNYDIFLQLGRTYEMKYTFKMNNGTLTTNNFIILLGGEATGSILLNTNPGVNIIEIYLYFYVSSIDISTNIHKIEYYLKVKNALTSVENYIFNSLYIPYAQADIVILYEWSGVGAIQPTAGVRLGYTLMRIA